MTRTSFAGEGDMLGWFRALLPREDKFFDLFEQHAATLVAAATALDQLLKDGENAPAMCAQIMSEEHKADLITADVMLAVRRTFITPFDRGDIQQLITSMDDAIDQMQKTAKAVGLFEVDAFEPSMQQLGGLIVNAARHTAELLPLLRSLNQNSPKINAIAGEIRRIEEESDEVQNQGLKALYQAHRASDAMGYIVGAEIYDHLERVVDRFEDVANRITGIVIEHL
jgi:uncharacterized protein